MEDMFYDCDSLTSVDLSSFDISRSNNMGRMFYSCEQLKSIFVSENFVVPQSAVTDEMFLNCYELVGGKGTVYDSRYLDGTYAKIDDGQYSESPGYLTALSSGTVLAAYGDPIEGATITVTQTESSTVKTIATATTDEIGAYTIALSYDTGYVTFSCSKEGYTFEDQYKEIETTPVVTDFNASASNEILTPNSVTSANDCASSINDATICDVKQIDKQIADKESATCKDCSNF